MLNIFARASISRFLDPAGCWLFRAGIGPDVITFTGAMGTVASALWFFPRGSTGQWRAPADTEPRSELCWTPPATGSPMVRCSPG
jgi:hypothetical protein